MKKLFTISLFLLFLLYGGGLTGQNDSLTLSSVSDNTLYSENNNSNGAGVHIFAGATMNGNLRRALVRFDLEAIPANATILSAELRVFGNKGEQNEVSLHRVTADWGEGTTVASGNQGQGGAPSPGGSTWNFRNFQDTAWMNEGGDFVQMASASTTVAFGETATWSSEDLVNDVQFWLSNPGENYGWIMIGEEDVNGSSMRMDSREGVNGPELAVVYGTSTTGLTPITEKDLQLTFQPNPTSDVGWIDWRFAETPAQLQLTIHSMLGQPVQRYILPSEKVGRQQVNTSSLSTGWYIATLQTESGFRSLRFYKN